jgi:hypothetical protein
MLGAAAMLNPEFRWLDPESDSINRMLQLFGQNVSKDLISAPGFDQIPIESRSEFLSTWVSRLAKPGHQSWAEIQEAGAASLADVGLSCPARQTLGWNDAELKRWFQPLQAPCVWLLGILDAEGIWCGGLAGLSRGGLDFLCTFNYLWAGQPELAAKQSLFDLSELCRSAAQRFHRPAGGLFIYRDEFMAWRNAYWSRDTLEHFLRSQTALEQQPY